VGASNQSEGEKMIRGLKVFLPALIAVCAVNAAAASMAAAQLTQGELTSVGSVRYTGTDEEGKDRWTAFGLRSECHGHYEGGKQNETEEVSAGKFRHKPTGDALTTLTIAPTYSSCSGVIGETVAPSTVTMNGCDYLLHLRTTDAANPGWYKVDTDIVCPAEKEIEMHVYTSSAHSSTICTVKVKAQTGLQGGLVTNAAGGKVTLKGPITGIHVTKTGVLCGGTATTTEGVLDIKAILEGINEAKETREISISENGA
jgi:hypothetical protein